MSYWISKVIQFPGSNHVRKREWQVMVITQDFMSSNKVPGPKAQGEALGKAGQLTGLFTEHLSCSMKCREKNQFRGQTT